MQNIKFLGIFTHDEKIYLVFYPMAARSPFAVTRWMMFHHHSQPWVKKECNNCSFKCVKKQQKTGVLSGCAAMKGGPTGPQKLPVSTFSGTSCVWLK